MARLYHGDAAAKAAPEGPAQPQRKRASSPVPLPPPPPPPSPRPRSRPAGDGTGDGGGAGAGAGAGIYVTVWFYSRKMAHMGQSTRAAGGVPSQKSCSFDQRSRSLHEG